MAVVTDDVGCVSVMTCGWEHMSVNGVIQTVSDCDALGMIVRACVGLLKHKHALCLRARRADVAFEPRPTLSIHKGLSRYLCTFMNYFETHRDAI